MNGPQDMGGMMGFGLSSRQIHTFKIESLSEDLPMIIEIVDTREKLEGFLETIEGDLGAGMVTLEKVQIRFYRGSAGDK